MTNALSKDNLILSGVNFQNLVYIFAKPIDQSVSEMLVLIDQACQGKTTAILGIVNNQSVADIKAGEIKFSPTHEMIITVPILTFD